MVGESYNRAYGVCMNAPENDIYMELLCMEMSFSILQSLLWFFPMTKIFSGEYYAQAYF